MLQKVMSEFVPKIGKLPTPNSFLNPIIITKKSQVSTYLASARHKDSGNAFCGCNSCQINMTHLVESKSMIVSKFIIFLQEKLFCVEL